MASYFPMVKNTAQRIVFPILDADGDPVTGAAGDTPDSEYSLDGGGFSDITDEIHEIATASGVYYLDLLSGETNGDVVAIQIKTATAGTKTTILVFYTSAQSLDAIDTNIDDIETDTNELQGLIASNKIAAQVKGIDDIDFPATQKTSLESAVDDGLDNAIGGSPTADSVAQRVKAIDLLTETNGSGDLAAILTDTEAIPTVTQIQTEMEEDGQSLLDTIRDELANGDDGLSALKTLIDNLQTQVDTTGVALLASAVDDIWDELLTGAAHNDATSAGRRLRAAGHDETIAREDTCQAGEDSTHVKLDAGASGANGFYDHMWIYLNTGTGQGQVRIIDSYVGNTFVAEVHPAWLVNPDGTTTFTIMARGEVFVHDIEAEGLAAIQAELEENGASILDTLNDKLPAAQKG